MELNSDKRSNALTALIIDDENDICFLLSNILRTSNIEAQFVNSISEGKSCMKSFNPDLLFLDNRLPDGYGIDFINYFKKEYRDIKIIMVTAHDSPEDRKRALHEGADVFISKPFSAVEIKKAVQQVYPNKN